MWFIFPQLKGLGKSTTSDFYGITNLKEAKLFLNHPVLGLRLLEITTAVLENKDKTAFEIFGTPDYLKLKSSMTLFSISNPENRLFKNVLIRFYNGLEDELTKLKLGF